MGHALVALALPGTDPVQKVSIIPRGIGALGYTIQRPTEDRFLMTRAGAREQDGGAARRPRRREHRVRRSLDRRGRRSREGHRHRARHGHALRHGRTGPRRLRDERRAASSAATAADATERSYSEETAREIDEAVQRIVERPSAGPWHCSERQRELLERKRLALLLEKETLDEAELEALLKQPAVAE